MYLLRPTQCDVQGLVSLPCIMLCFYKLGGTSRKTQVKLIHFFYVLFTLEVLGLHIDILIYMQSRLVVVCFLKLERN